MKNPQPLTVIKDRYLGTYSGFRFHAWPKNLADVDRAVFADDVTCGYFWEWVRTKDICVGLGETRDEAVKDLIKKMASGAEYDQTSIYLADWLP